jgi:hypothetical protein
MGAGILLATKLNHGMSNERAICDGCAEYEDECRCASKPLVPATGYVVAATLTRSTQDGWSTRVETKLLMWIGLAVSEDEAVGFAVRTMLDSSHGYALQMHVACKNPHSTELCNPKERP